MRLIYVHGNAPALSANSALSGYTGSRDDAHRADDSGPAGPVAAAHLEGIHAAVQGPLEGCRRLSPVASVDAHLVGGEVGRLRLQMHEEGDVVAGALHSKAGLVQGGIEIRPPVRVMGHGFSWETKI